MGNKYIITSSQSCSKPNKNFINGLEKYAKENGSEIIILPMIGKDAKEDIDKIDSYFEKFNVEIGSKKLNNNIQIQQFNIRPYQIDPTTGLERFVQRETTQVFASPKQRLKSIPHSLQKIPKFLVTTGACTLPNYATGNDVSAERRRLGNIAKRDHIYGALIVEIENKEKFYIRNIRADSKGKFVDLGVKYNGEEIGKSDLEALVIGDWHTGYTDSVVKMANLKMIEELNPKRIFLHDLFDGHSVSPFKYKRLISEQIIEGIDKRFNILEEELESCYKELNIINRFMKRKDIYVVASNHNEFLEGYLDEGRFIKDAINSKISFKLAGFMAEGLNPLEEGVKMFGKLPSNIHFLKRDQDYKVRGYQLGAHGDMGRFGGSRSIKSKEDDYGKSISGHVHNLGVLRDTYTVGTSTPLNLFYTEGQPTNWVNGNCALWDNGLVQYIPIINGKYRLKN